MALSTKIIDGGGTGTAASIIQKSAHLPAGMFTYTEDYHQTVSKFRTVAMTNETYGEAMNINANFGGTPVVVYDGGDSVAWTPSAIAGTWDFVSTAVAHSGTKSVDATATVNNDAALFTKAASFSTAGYTAVSGWIYLTSWSASGTKNVNVRARLAGVAVGTAVGLSSYINTSTLGVWQKFVIPKSALGITATTIDELTITTIDIGAGSPADYYLDDIQFEETGGALQYFARPRVGYQYNVTHIGVFMADALTGNYPANLSYNKLLNVAALSAGFTFSAVQGGETIFSGNFKQLSDIVRLPVANDMYGGSDGTNTWFKIGFDMTDANVRLDASSSDYFLIEINDDLSGLLEFNVFTRGVDIKDH